MMTVTKRKQGILLNGVRILIAVVIAVALMSGTRADATPLYLSLKPEPDIFADFISISYDATTKSFKADGFSEKLNLSNLTTQGTFSIAATIDNSGSASAGSLTITGVAGTNGSPLLTASHLEKFGYYTTTDTIEFLFSGLAGSLASQYGSTAGVILSLTGWAPVDFTKDYTGSGNALADTGSPVPLPATVLLLAPGMGILYRLRRRGIEDT